jgi:hypothetical protein
MDMYIEKRTVETPCDRLVITHRPILTCRLPSRAIGIWLKISCANVYRNQDGGIGVTRVVRVELRSLEIGIEVRGPLAGLRTVKGSCHGRSVAIRTLGPGRQVTSEEHRFCWLALKKWRTSFACMNSSFCRRLFSSGASVPGCLFLGRFLPHLSHQPNEF